MTRWCDIDEAVIYHVIVSSLSHHRHCFIALLHLHIIVIVPSLHHHRTIAYIVVTLKHHRSIDTNVDVALVRW